MNIRWPLVASIVALFAGAGLAALVLALCGEEAEGPGGPQARATPRVMVTRTPIVRTRTPRAGTPAATRTPRGGTPVPGQEETPPAEEETPPAEEETPPAAEETPPAEETPSINETPIAGQTPTPGPPVPTATPRPQEATATPGPPSPTTTATFTPTPALPPDLIVLDVGVFYDQLVVVVSNAGEGPLPAGTQIDIGVRGIVADSVVLNEALPPGGNFTAVLADQVIYRPEVVLAQVDPNNLIPEENDNNNSLTLPLVPDITPDLGLTGIDAVGTNRHLVVDIANTTEAPIRQAGVTLQAFRCGDPAPVTAMNTTFDVARLGSVRIDIFPAVIVLPGGCWRVAMRVSNIPDADPDNNEVQRAIP